MSREGEAVRVDLMADGNPYGESALRFLQEIKDEVAHPTPRRSSLALTAGSRSGSRSSWLAKTISKSSSRGDDVAWEGQEADGSWLELQTANPPREKQHRTDLLLEDQGVGRGQHAEHMQR